MDFALSALPLPFRAESSQALVDEVRRQPIQPDPVLSPQDWLDWLRALIRWLVTPWQSRTAVVARVAHLEASLAVHGDTLKQLQGLLDFDPFTGAYSRNYFMSGLRQVLAAFSRDAHASAGKEFTIGILDLDNLKQLNDRHGHFEGDRVLRHVVEQAQQILRRQGDIFARFGGDEFVFLLPQTPLEGALVLAEQLRAALAALPRPLGWTPITVSIGLAACPTHDAKPEALLDAADRALYRAKTTRNAVWVAKDL